MDFFDRQDRARRRTLWLIAYFGLALALTILAVYLAFALIFLSERARGPGVEWVWDPALFAGVTLGTSFVVFLGSIVKIMELSRGGSAVAAMLGGTPVRPDTTDRHERKLLNVVEEMALASGVPVPRVFVLREEEGINAFAAGLQTRDSAVGVTRGCMRLLTRDELQGVIAHEFSHILNGDMRLNLRLIGIINGLLVLTIIGRQLLRVRGSTRSRNGKGGNPLPLIGLALLVIGGIGMLFARLIKSAVSRQREFLADAAAVQFTRNPAGLAGALKKIGGLAAGSRIGNAHAEQASHLFFSNGLAASWIAWFSTHPPLEERIRALDPQFDGRFPRNVTEAPADPGPAARPPGTDFDLVLPGVAALAPADAAPPPKLSKLRLQPREVIAQTGAPTSEHLEYAGALKARLPAALIEATREPLSAAGLVLSLVLSRDPAERQRQLDGVEAVIREEYFAGLPAIAAAVAALPEPDRLPLAMLALPALAALSPSQYQRFAELLQGLVESDASIELFEYALQRMVRRHLAPQFEEGRTGALVQFYAMQPLRKDCVVLLSALAHQGEETPGGASAAFAAGAGRLGKAVEDLPLLEAGECGLAEVDRALDRLAFASPAIKRQVLEACVETVSVDGQLNLREAELLRAIADTLDCPLPPILNAG